MPASGVEPVGGRLPSAEAASWALSVATRPVIWSGQARIAAVREK